jgi:long-chain acyl-CoA synthetase
MLNLSVLLEDSARRYANKTAFIFGETALSFAQVDHLANQVANGLKSKGIQPGDKVAISCLNLPYFPIIYFGILKVGAVVVPLSVLLKKDEIIYHLTDSDAKAYFCFSGTADLPMGQTGHTAVQELAHPIDFYLIMPQLTDASAIIGVSTLGHLMADQAGQFETYASNAEDTAVIVYTSGTTGKPKGAELTHSNLAFNAILSSNLVQTTPEDTQLIVLPLFHIFAMTVLMNAGVYKGATSVLLPRFDAAAAFALMSKHKVTVFAGVPTMYWGLLHYTEPTVDFDAIAQQLRICVSGGASLPVQVMKDFEARFNVAIIEGYGMSEGAPVVTFNHSLAERKAGSIGKPVWGVEVKLVDIHGNEVPVGEKGELLYRGHNVMKGYYKKNEATAETIKNGWLHSGDIAIKDEDGFYFIVDRTKDMIIRGGLNVYPRELEELMIQHEAISMVAVVGVPSDEFGEDIKAFVVLKEGASATEQEIIEWTKARIAAYKYPRSIEFIPALPMSATGKILKRELRTH